MKEFFYEVRKENRSLLYKLYIHKIGPFRFNWHKEIEINIVLRGRVELCVEGSKYLLEEDDCMIINSNSGHATLAKEPDSMAMVLHIDPVCFKEYFKEYESLRFENIISLSSINNEKRKVIKYLLASLIWQLKKHSSESKMISDAIFALVMVNLIEVFPPSVKKEDKVKNSKSQIEVISKLLKYIEEMHKEKLPLSKIADMLGYNHSYFSQFFKVNIGINYYEYLTRVRTREATLELAKTNRSISDIALDHGFSDVKAFNKSFKESFGRLPNEYRSEMRESKIINQSFLRRVFVQENDEYINTKLKEYRNLLQDNILFMNEIAFKEEDMLKEELNIKKYKNRITELEKKLEELNKKIELMRSILQ